MRTLRWCLVFVWLGACGVLVLASPEPLDNLDSTSALDCQNVFRAEPGQSGNLSSPGYPRPYPSHTSCTWTIAFPEDSTITLRLTDLDIEEDADCNKGLCCSKNWLKFSTRHLCGQQSREIEFTAKKENLVIKFHSSKVIRGGRGFHIQYLTCKKDQFRCADNLNCLDSWSKCDGIKECKDGSDEWECKDDKIFNEECGGTNMVPCGGLDNTCYNNASERCDGNIDCPITASDEANCMLCGRSKLYCKSGGCYPLNGACDNIVHCSGGWDEGLRGGCGVCTGESVPCGFHNPCNCFHAHLQRCDGQMDCPRGEDETSCVPGCENKIACASVQGCYSPSERCDGTSQCMDNSDEVGCLGRSFPAKFRCASAARCIDDFMVCNGIDDCGDGSDESDCLKNSLITVVVMGSLISGLLAVLGVAIGWRYYSSRSRANVLGTQNAYQRHENIEPLDDSTLYHLYREPPPSYQEAIMQGASPPMYWHPTRLMNMSAHGEAAPPASVARCPRPRSSSSRPRSSRVIPEVNQLVKPITEPFRASQTSSEVISSDQLYPDNSALSDSDTPMLELSDNNVGTSGTDNFTSDSSTSTPTSASSPHLMSSDPHSSYQST